MCNIPGCDVTIDNVTIEHDVTIDHVTIEHDVTIEHEHSSFCMST